jgi:hypothetical protein
MRGKFLGYSDSTGDVIYYPSETDWLSEITPAGAQRYLREHIGEQLKDFPIIYDAFCVSNAAGGPQRGSFSLPRMLFPHLEALGLLANAAIENGRSKDTENAIAFIEDYLSRADPLYSSVGRIAYEIYRHGLTHTALPKSLEREDGEVFSWAITGEESSHLGWYQERMLMFCPARFWRDLNEALNIYIEELGVSPRNQPLFEKFKKGFVHMGKAHKPTGKTQKALNGPRP